MSIIDNLVTDRSQSDVDALRALLSRGKANWTAEELAEFNLARSKGAYNYTDLNRVTEAMDALDESLRGYGYVTGYAPLYISGGRTEWEEGDIPTQSQMAAYLANVTALRSALTVWADTPSVPADMAGLTYQEANDIETILGIIETLINNMAAAWFYSGDVYSGEGDA